jgi:hypothetical protein
VHPSPVAREGFKGRFFLAFVAKRADMLTMKTIEIAVPETPDAPALRKGVAYRLSPVRGEANTIVAYHVIDDDDVVAMTLPVSAVKVVERP